MSADAAGSPDSIAVAEQWAADGVADNDVLAAALARAAELGVPAVDAATGATLRLLTAAVGARAVIEAGTGAGVSGLWLLAGMQPDGILTTIDVEAEHQRAARQAFTEAGVPTSGFRLINASAGEVMPRMTDGAYDVVVVDADRPGYPGYLAQAARLLRAGGIVAFVGVLAGGRVMDAGARDAAVVSLREVAAQLADDDRFDGALLPVGDGVLAAVRH